MRLGTGPISLVEEGHSESSPSPGSSGARGVASAAEWLMNPEAQCSMPVAWCIILYAAKLILPVWVSCVRVKLWSRRKIRVLYGEL